MKKKILLVGLLVVLVAAVSVGLTVAYLTSTDTAKNTFTVGDVDIELLESNLHRENAGVANDATSDSELWSDVDKLGTPTSEYKAGDTCYTDDQIKADAAKYQDLLKNNGKLNPGQSYHKMPYVVNTGSNNAYIRIRMMFPAALDTAILNSSMYTTTALNKGEFTMEHKDDASFTDENGVAYNTYVFTRVKPLAPGEMTYWNVWGTVHMDTDVTNAELKALVPNGTFDVLVQADAIQADGFDSAEAAFAAFPAE